MWGTPQRSRRISTGFRKPGTATVSAPSDGAIKIAQHKATPRIYLSDFEAGGVDAAGLESALPDDSEAGADPLPLSPLLPLSLLPPPFEASSLGLGSLLFPLP